MNVTFACPKCDRAVRVEFDADAARLACPMCAETIGQPAAVGDGQLERCVVCRSKDIYARKDFPQRLGVLIVVLGFAASSVTWAYSRPIWTFAILFATALIDVVLYLVMPTALVCYHCGAAYRGLANMDRYSGFELDTHERHRQQRIRTAQQKRMDEEHRANGIRTDSSRRESAPIGGQSTGGAVQ